MESVRLPDRSSEGLRRGVRALGGGLPALGFGRRSVAWHRFLACLSLAASLQVWGCGGGGAGGSDPDPPQSRSTGDAEGLRMCCELGAVCHPGADEPADSLVSLCHELGHSNQPEACRAQYEECLMGCVGNEESPEHACL